MSTRFWAFCLKHNSSAIQLDLKTSASENAVQSWLLTFGSVTAFLLLFGIVAFLLYSNTDNSRESKDSITVSTSQQLSVSGFKSLHVTKPQFLYLVKWEQLPQSSLCCGEDESKSGDG